MSNSPFSGTTWKITTIWASAPKYPDVYTATFNANGSLTIAEPAFAARSNAKATDAKANDAKSNGYWTSNGQMISFCVAVFASPSGAPDAVGGYGGSLSSNNMSGSVSGYMLQGTPHPEPGTWTATKINSK